MPPHGRTITSTSAQRPASAAAIARSSAAGRSPAVSTRSAWARLACAIITRSGTGESEVSGIAFGIGTSRLGAQSVNIVRARSLYEMDLRVHRAIQRGS